MGELGERCKRLMELRNFSPKTKQAYLHHLKGLYYFHNLPLQELNKEHLENYLHDLFYKKKLSWSNVNIAYSAFKFFYELVLGNPLALKNIPRPKRGRKLPQILAKNEVMAIFKKTIHPKYRLFFMTIYAAGLRISEASHLKLNDIDSKRRQIRVRQGKGKKDRYTILSEKLLGELRNYWRWQRPLHWLFPSDKTPDKPIDHSTARRLFTEAKKKPVLKKTSLCTPCVIVLPPICWKPVMIYLPSRNC